MEHAIIHSDLLKEDIQPKQLLDRYIELLEDDIRTIFKTKEFIDIGCPVNGETTTKETFEKMGMNYHVSTTLGNIYLSPRPNRMQLINFYHRSKARKFWLTELLPQTISLRKHKIIQPQMEWVQTFIKQYLNNKAIFAAEYYPNHWGYYLYGKELELGWHYKLLEPLFSASFADRKEIGDDILLNVDTQQFNVILLFEALDRSEDPSTMINWINEHLKPGGLCFITCLLSSGFEIQVLGHSSGVFIPPERMNIFSYEGLNALIEKIGGLETIEFSTPGVLDIPNVMGNIEQIGIHPFFKYIFQTRMDSDLTLSFREFLQMNRLSTYGRLVLRKL